MNCPLCESTNCKTLNKINSKIYHRCNNCGLFFLDKSHFLNSEEEKTRYNFHQNNIEDKGYVKFLNQLAEPLEKFLEKNSQGLDFGCGPNPVLAELFNRKNFYCAYYDPFFYPKLNKKFCYDFITASECFEHFFSVKKEIELINSILKPKGYLGIMNELVTDFTDFENWYYIKDPSHVCFYSLKSFEFICEKYNYSLRFTDNKRVIILQK